MTFVVSVAHTNFLCVAYNATTIYAQLSNPWIKSHTYVLRHAAVWCGSSVLQSVQTSVTFNLLCFPLTDEIKEELEKQK